MLHGELVLLFPRHTKYQVNYVNNVAFDLLPFFQILTHKLWVSGHRHG
jgi:hypothetical protein